MRTCSGQPSGRYWSGRYQTPGKALSLRLARASFRPGSQWEDRWRIGAWLCTGPSLLSMSKGSGIGIAPTGIS